MTDLPAILDALEAEKLARTDYPETQNGYRLTIGFAPGEVVLIHHDPDDDNEPVSLDDPNVIVLNVDQARTLAHELERAATLAETCHPTEVDNQGTAGVPVPRLTIIHGGRTVQ